MIPLRYVWRQEHGAAAVLVAAALAALGWTVKASIFDRLTAIEANHVKIETRLEGIDGKLDVLLRCLKGKC